MKSKLITIIAIILVVASVAGAIIYFHVPQELGFGYEVKLMEAPFGATPFTANASGGNVEFNQAAYNAAIMGVNVTARGGWGAFQVRPYTITAISDNYLLNLSGNSSGTFMQGGQIVHYTKYAGLNHSDFHVVRFLKISNPLSQNVTLHMTENLTGGRVVSYNVSSASNPTFGYLVALSNGSIVARNQTNTTNYSLIGEGSLLAGNASVILQPNTNLCVFLGIIPSEANNGTTIFMSNILSFGALTISV